MNFSMDDLKSINILLSSIKDFPDDNLIETMSKFLNNIEFRMNTSDKISLDTIRQNNNYSFPFQYLELKQQIMLPAFHRFGARNHGAQRRCAAVGNPRIFLSRMNGKSKIMG